MEVNFHICHDRRSKCAMKEENMNQYRLAVCEDSEIIRREICRMSEEILSDADIEHQITGFSSADALWEKIEAGKGDYDLLLLDIQMKDGMDGMELAFRLREAGDRISLIFFSGYDAYLPRGYKVQPVDFLQKPVKKEELARALRTDWRLNHLSRTLTLEKQGGRIYRFPVNEIRYVEGKNHSVILCREKDSVQIPFSLTEVEEKLRGTSFVRCHRSFLVNLDFSVRLEYLRLYLLDGSSLPVGRTYYRSFQEKLVRYMNH